MSADGYVKLHRRSLDSWLWKMPPDQRCVAMTLLLMANWKDGKTFSRGRVVVVRRGEVMTSLDALARRVGVSVRTIRTSLDNLEKAGFSTNTSTKHYRLISITNFEAYQSREEVTDKQTDSAPTSDRQATDNDRRREEGKKGRTSRTSSSEVQAAASYFLEGFNSYFGQARQPRAWLDDVRKALAAGYTPAQMRGAAWGAKQRCADSPDVLKNFRPSTVLRLKSREGKTTLPQWIELADETWDELNPGDPAPWRTPRLEVVNG